ncbi:hypothetical protein F5X98DRAFT_358895 [Xylaria grammica]|nr:hypothetical protein F5X98DRAFT_358895 [Xylaria grammica]
MAFEIWRNSTQLAQFILLITFTPLGIAVTALRFVAIRRTARKPGFEDWMAVLATLFFALTNLGGLIAISFLNGRTVEQEARESPSDYSNMRKWDFSALFFYFVHALTVKLSVLGLFYRIFRVNQTYRRWIYALGIAQSVLTLLFIILHPLTCKPFYRYFDLSIQGSCRSDGSTVLAGETPNSLIDIVMVVLAMFMIRPLKLAGPVKWSLRILFGMGAIVGIIGFVKIGITYSAARLYAFSLVSIWTCVQMFVSLLCSCLPIIHHSFSTIKFRGLLRGVPGYGSFRRLWLTKKSRNQSTSDPPSMHTRGWDSLDEYGGTPVPAWPEAKSHTTSHTLGDFPLQEMHSQPHEIRVERRFDVI